MSVLRNHVVLMFLYAALTSIFFTLLWKQERPRPERVRFAAIVFCSLFIGGIALGWLMYPFPLK